MLEEILVRTAGVAHLVFCVGRSSDETLNNPRMSFEKRVWV